MRVRWLSLALRNLKEEADYIAKDDPQAPTRIVAKIESTVAMLADQPSLGRAGRLPGTRELVIVGTPYLVPYRVRNECVDILRVFHGRRRWPVQL